MMVTYGKFDDLIENLCYIHVTNDNMNPLQNFNDKPVRTAWSEEQNKWYFSIVDVITVLTDSIDPPAYWRKLKQRLFAEGNEPMTNCLGLKMMAVDGKMRLTDVADTEQLFRLIQRIQSPKAEKPLMKDFVPLPFRIIHKLVLRIANSSVDQKIYAYASKKHTALPYC